MILFKYIKKPETLWLLIILFVAAGLRFYDYGRFSYSNDELSALNRLHYDTFAELVLKGFYVDGHPGGVQVFLWQWVRLFGDNEWTVRLPFVLMGILSVWMSYKVARFMFGTAAGLFTAAALTFLQFPLLYSQIARPYGPGLLFSLMLIYFWLKIFFNENGGLSDKKPTIIHLSGFTLSAALCMYTHYFSFLFALIVGFSGFAVARRKNIFRYIGAAVVAALLFVPHIPITLNHLTFKGVGLWLGPPDKTWAIEHLYVIFDRSLFTILVFFITLATLLYLYNENKSKLRFRLFLVLWFLMPLLIGYFYSVKINPVLQDSVLIFSFPCFIMLIFSYAGAELSRKRSWILALFFISGVSGTTVINKYYQKQHFSEFKDMARITAQWQKQYSDTAITKAININNPLYIDYYFERYKAKVRFDLYAFNDQEGLKSLSEIVRHSQTPYFLYGIAKPTPPEGEDIVRSTFPYVVEMQSYDRYSSLVLFGRVKGQTYEKANHLTEIKTIKANLDADTLVPNSLDQPVIAHKMDSLSEYSPAIEVSLDEFSDVDQLFLKAETDLFATSNTGESILVISIETNDGKSILWKGALSAYVEIPGKWCHVINTLKIDKVIPKGAILKVYFWNKDKKVLYLYNLQFSIYQKM